MEITLVCYTAEEYRALIEGCTAEEFAECYGADAEKLFFARKGDEENSEDGAYVGVQYKDGSCGVYGVRRDEEGLTFAGMLERLVREFV